MAPGEKRRFFHLSPWQDHVTPFQEHEEVKVRRRYVVNSINQARLAERVWVVIVAGVGFMTDAYDIFALNMIIPMLGDVYYGGTMPHSYEIGLNIATLGGSIIGQLLFGIFADMYGRRKMYGLELVITIGATLALAMCGSGAAGNMSLLGWLLFWRLIVGIGIGADYPLSGVITAEMAPEESRGLMLAIVFFCQPLGQTFATVVSIVATAAYGPHVPSAATLASCGTDAGCMATVDSVWRWVIGFGVVPAVVAVFFRLTIPESPRYTLDVVQNGQQAVTDAQGFFMSREDAPQDSLQLTAHDLPSEESAMVLPEQSWADAKEYFLVQGNIKTLIATSVTWMLLDLPFFGLGLNSPRIIALLWLDTPQPGDSVYEQLMNNATHSLVVASTGALIGSLILFLIVERLPRKWIQFWGFVALAVMFIVIGSTFQHLLSNNLAGAIIPLYVICQILFNCGPNSTTYIIAAEVFPTRYRCTCVGISAAFGKLGSVVAQVFLGYVKFGTANYLDQQDWLGYVLLVFSAFMIVGAILTYFWIPDTQTRDGRSLPLEDLALGRKQD
ncbi:MAG: Inorganic phosphate transporter pho84 [Thelocarpon superellum]|nr:MAG: Inorganic phosphate transporter pho84 [Thelocarpon superellum]